MNPFPRWFPGLVAAVFACYHAVLGVSALGSLEQKIYPAIAILIYLAVVLPTIIFYRSTKMPVAQAIVNVAAAAIIPLLANSGVDPLRAPSYSTWYVIGIATLMAATAIRQHIVAAWLGTIIMTIGISGWAGFWNGIQFGVPGALALVFAGSAIAIGLGRSFRETAAFNEEAIELLIQKTSDQVASEIRATRVGLTMERALPILNAIKDQSGILSEEQKKEARLLEAALRDEIRGRELLTKDIRASVLSARERGVEVAVLDEGGLASATLDEKSEILKQLPQHIDQVTEGRLTIRSPQDEKWRVTLVASRPGFPKPDIWIKL